MERSTQEIAEIDRHKYFLSEKQGYDVGWEYAESDWEQHYGSEFRQQNELENSCCEAIAGCDSAPQSESTDSDENCAVDLNARNVEACTASNSSCAQHSLREQFAATSKQSETKAKTRLDSSHEKLQPKPTGSSGNGDLALRFKRLFGRLFSSK